MPRPTRKAQIPRPIDPQINTIGPPLSPTDVAIQRRATETRRITSRRQRHPSLELSSSNSSSTESDSDNLNQENEPIRIRLILNPPNQNLEGLQQPTDQPSTPPSVPFSLPSYTPQRQRIRRIRLIVNTPPSQRRRREPFQNQNTIMLESPPPFTLESLAENVNALQIGSIEDPSFMNEVTKFRSLLENWSLRYCSICNRLTSLRGKIRPNPDHPGEFNCRTCLDQINKNSIAIFSKENDMDPFPV
jgi:hypothetical protein